MKRAIVVLLLLGGCATPYKGSGLMGGYSETQLAPNAWHVRFYGNAYTSSERASDFLLLRVAELMVENDYPYFMVEALTSSVDANDKPSTAISVLGFTERFNDPSVYDSEFLARSIRDKYGLTD